MLNRKAQFFIISTIIITTTIVSLQGVFSGYGEIDTSTTGSFSEDFLFNNIKSEVMQVYDNYPCPDAEINLKELTLKSEEWIGEKGMVLTIDYNENDVCDAGTKQTVSVNMTIESFNGVISDVFSLS